jgi:hypothetical protein
MSHIHWVLQQNKLEIARRKDEVNKREIHECDGLVHEGCLLWIEKTRGKDKTYEWGSVRWETKSKSWGIYMSHKHWVVRQKQKGGFVIHFITAK